MKECLLDPVVESVLSIGRSPEGVTHQKLHENVHKDQDAESICSAR